MASMPISMEDAELFPKTKCIDLDQSTSASHPSSHINLALIDAMLIALSKSWWSRLIIAVRGYVGNYFQSSDETVFLLDDAFIHLHRIMVESSDDDAPHHQLLADLDTIVNWPNTMQLLDELQHQTSTISNENNPFYTPECVASAFRRVFGAPSSHTYYVAAKQMYAYVVFVRVLTTLQSRWQLRQVEATTKKKKRSIRFVEDPDWQPDDRVLIFQQFFQGNRTWVLTDFDRHVLMCWRPHGVALIFGDRYLQTKLDDGYRLCNYCGMLEQHPGQFPSIGKAYFCSRECADHGITSDDAQTGITLSSGARNERGVIDDNNGVDTV